MTGRVAPELVGFRFLEHLGSGGFADVYKYENLGRAVAVKVLHGNLGADNQRAFEAEAHTMAKLSNHPNVVSIFDAGRAQSGSAYLVMEFCPPPNLATRVRGVGGVLTPRHALEIGIQIAGAVESAHRLGILHRDIKPANILVTEFGRPALTDFGISSSTSVPDAYVAEGVSVPWAPPEQLTRGGDLTAAADVYALAATLWTLLAGRAPFEEPTGPNDALAMAKRIRTVPPPRVPRPDVPESLQAALMSGLAKAPTNRFATAESFARALQAVQAELRLPMTTMDAVQVVPLGGSWAAGAPPAPPGTRVVGFVSIDPEEAPERTVGRNGGPTSTTSRRMIDHIGTGRGPTSSSWDVAGEVVGGSARTDTSSVAVGDGSSPPRGGSVQWVLVGIAAAVAVVALALLGPRLLGVVASDAPAPSSPTVLPADALGASVPDVAGLAIERVEGRVTASWQQVDSATFEDLYRFYDRDEKPGEFMAADEPEVTASASTKDLCIDVVRRNRTTGASSAQIATRCLP